MSQSCLTAAEERAVYRASKILLKKLQLPAAAISTPALAKQYFTLALAAKPVEEFHIAYLDAAHRLIEARCISVGTVTSTTVYPREVVRSVITVNASAVILAHNHPSGQLDPSAADISLTRSLKNALALIDVTILDHIICGPTGAVSMAEMGCM